MISVDQPSMHVAVAIITTSSTRKFPSRCAPADKPPRIMTSGVVAGQWKISPLLLTPQKVKSTRKGEPPELTSMTRTVKQKLEMYCTVVSSRSAARFVTEHLCRRKLEEAVSCEHMTAKKSMNTRNVVCLQPCHASMRRW